MVLHIWELESDLIKRIKKIASTSRGYFKTINYKLKQTNYFLPTRVMSKVISFDKTLSPSALYATLYF